MRKSTFYLCALLALLGCDEVETAPPTIGENITLDADQDGVPDADDSCPQAPNMGQEDADGDGVGDQCDNCPSAPNAGQEDADRDDVGDVCDNCPDVPNANQANNYGDERGDVCDVFAECDLPPDAVTVIALTDTNSGRDDNDWSGADICGAFVRCGETVATPTHTTLHGRVGDVCESAESLLDGPYDCGPYRDPRSARNDGVGCEDVLQLVDFVSVGIGSTLTLTFADGGCPRDLRGCDITVGEQINDLDIRPEYYEVRACRGPGPDDDCVLLGEQAGGNFEGTIPGGLSEPEPQPEAMPEPEPAPQPEPAPEPALPEPQPVPGIDHEAINAPGIYEFSGIPADDASVRMSVSLPPSKRFEFSTAGPRQVGCPGDTVLIMFHQGSPFAFDDDSGFGRCSKFSIRIAEDADYEVEVLKQNLPGIELGPFSLTVREVR